MGWKWCIAEFVEMIGVGAVAAAGVVLETAETAAGDDVPEYEMPVDPEDSRVV